MTSVARRAALLLAKTVNGVDFVEVVPPGGTNLVVHFVLPLPDAPSGDDPVPDAPDDALGASNFAVAGGERITAIAVTAALRIAPDQMQVTVDQVGDFSPYTLSLVDASTPTGIPPGFDPASSCASFLFHIDCANSFDCAPTSSCQPPFVAPPPINYLAKDYPSFVQLMLDRMSLLAPGWQERNAADLGVALVELFAYVGDQLSYREDVIATEAYLGTARLRSSARRHARLVDYYIGEGQNARVWLRILLGPSWADGNTVPAGTRFATWYPGSAGSQLVRESLAYTQAIDAGAVFFETTGTSDPLVALHDEMPLYAWSETSACLAPGATRATLSGAYPALQAGMVLVLAETLDPQNGAAADADPTHRQAVRLCNVLVTEDPLNGQAVTEIDWCTDDALSFPLCIAATIEEGSTPVVISPAVAWGNIVLADNGRRVGDGSDPLTGAPEQLAAVPLSGRYRPSLADVPVTFSAPLPSDPATAAAADFAVTTGTPVPVVTLTSSSGESSQTTEWSPAPGGDLFAEDVLASSPVFVVEVENDGTAFLLFGDGVSGLLPDPSDTFVASYRVGNGTAGNVGRDAVVLVDGTGLPGGVPGGVAGVTNPLPAFGGVDPETVDHVRQSAPVAFRTQLRAVTAADYQSLVQSYQGVQRAAATLRWTGSWHTVFITVQRSADASLQPSFIADLESYLDSYRMAGVDLAVEDGVQVPLLLEMSVCVQPTYVATDVEQALLSIFTSGVQHDGAPGLFNPSQFELGQSVYLSPLVAAAQAVDGVASVQVQFFGRETDTGGGSGLASGVLVPRPLEFFVLDNDPNYPERGQFELTVAGGL